MPGTHNTTLQHGPRLRALGIIFLLLIGSANPIAAKDDNVPTSTLSAEEVQDTPGTYVPPKPLEKIVIPYPVTLYRLTRGYARINFTVDTAGRPGDFVVLQATHPNFGQIVIETLKETTFEPATLDDVPVIGQLILETDFRMGYTAIERKITDTEIYAEHAFEQRVHTVDELDRPLHALEQPAPVYPETLATYAGSVLVKFYIDPDGNVLAPWIISSSHKDFSEAVLDAIKEWKFEAPTAKGRPVYVIARQNINFK